MGVDSQGVCEVCSRVGVDLRLLGWSGEGGWRDDVDRGLRKTFENLTQLCELLRG